MPRLTIALSAALAVLTAGALPAAAQAPDCQSIAGSLKERQEIVKRINGLGKNKIDPRKACTAFGSLASNGDKILKFVEANKAWCQIPDSFADGLKEDHKRVTDMRGKACKVAAQVTQAEKQARQNAQQQQGRGAFGGPGLTGEFKVPQGAL